MNATQALALDITKQSYNAGEILSHAFIPGKFFIDKGFVNSNLNSLQCIFAGIAASRSTVERVLKDNREWASLGINDELATVDRLFLLKGLGLEWSK